MINLGIVISVSKYSNITNLPACAQDGKAIELILKASGKFTEIITISDDTSSGSTKKQLTRFLGRYKGEPIDEIVFYFTGHGDFVGDEFLYLFTDYDEKRARQTSLENSELDNLIRQINPALFVKIVDACHSGSSYIKGASEFDKYLKSASVGFKKLYFMYSSQTSQQSYQDKHLSDFTKAVATAIATHTKQSIRYKDITDHVSDAFIGNKSQTPFFVIQADLVEIFSTISIALKTAMNSLLSAAQTGSPRPGTSTGGISLSPVQSRAREHAKPGPQFDLHRHQELVEYAFFRLNCGSRQEAADWADRHLSPQFDLQR